MPKTGPRLFIETITLVEAIRQQYCRDGCLSSRISNHEFFAAILSYNALTVYSLGLGLIYPHINPSVPSK